jgi:hypothetical protein
MCLPISCWHIPLDQPYHGSKASMHLLQSNVDLNMIRSWLGRASTETTRGYVEIDLEMKRKTLQSCEKLLPPKLPDKARQSPSWQRHPVLDVKAVVMCSGWIDSGLSSWLERACSVSAMADMLKAATTELGLTLRKELP